MPPGGSSHVKGNVLPHLMFPFQLGSNTLFQVTVLLRSNHPMLSISIPYQSKAPFHCTDLKTEAQRGQCSPGNPDICSLARVGFEPGSAWVHPQRSSPSSTISTGREGWGWRVQWQQPPSHHFTVGHFRDSYKMALLFNLHKLKHMQFITPPRRIIGWRCAHI